MSSNSKELKVVVDLENFLGYVGDELKQFVNDERMRIEKENDAKRAFELEKLKLQNAKEIEAERAKAEIERVKAEGDQKKLQHEREAEEKRLAREAEAEQKKLQHEREVKDKRLEREAAEKRLAREAEQKRLEIEAERAKAEAEEINKRNGS